MGDAGAVLPGIDMAGSLGWSQAVRGSNATSNETATIGETVEGPRFARLLPLRQKMEGRLFGAGGRRAELLLTSVRFGK